MLNTEHEKWENLMKSCRQVCKILHEDFQEPMYLDWTAGRNYYQNLWGRVRSNKHSKIIIKGV